MSLLQGSECSYAVDREGCQDKKKHESILRLKKERRSSILRIRKKGHDKRSGEEKIIQLGGVVMGDGGGGGGGTSGADIAAGLLGLTPGEAAEIGATTPDAISGPSPGEGGEGGVGIGGTGDIIPGARDWEKKDEIKEEKKEAGAGISKEEKVRRKRRRPSLLEAEEGLISSVPSFNRSLLR